MSLADCGLDGLTPEQLRTPSGVAELGRRMNERLRAGGTQSPIVSAVMIAKAIEMVDYQPTPGLRALIAAYYNCVSGDGHDFGKRIIENALATPRVHVR